jgi:hypothetical protein
MKSQKERDKILLYFLGMVSCAQVSSRDLDDVCICECRQQVCTIPYTAHKMKHVAAFAGILGAKHDVTTRGRGAYGTASWLPRPRHSRTACPSWSPSHKHSFPGVRTRQEVPGVRRFRRLRCLPWVPGLQTCRPRRLYREGRGVRVLPEYHECRGRVRASRGVPFLPSFQVCPERICTEKVEPSCVACIIIRINSKRLLEGYSRAGHWVQRGPRLREVPPCHGVQQVPEDQRLLANPCLQWDPVKTII